MKATDPSNEVDVTASKTPAREYVNTSIRDTYRPGDGDTFKQPTRPGAEHAFTIPSRGLR